MSETSSAQFYGAYLRASRKLVPMTVLLEVNHRCHLDCVQCYLEDNHDPQPAAEILSFEEICRVIDELHAAGCLILALSGGEVFLRKDILAIVRHARRRGLAVRVFTSGTLLDRARVQEMAELYLASVEITLYSMDAKIHDGITRSEGSHAKTLQGIELCARAGLPLMLKTPLMRENFHGYREVRTFSRSLGAAFRCDPTITPQHDGNLKTTTHRLNAFELAELYADRELDGSIIACSNEDLPDPSRRTCAIGERSCVISPWGDVFPCMEVHELAGNVRQQPFEQIWRHSPVFERVRSLTVGDLSVCGGCSKVSYCQRCNGMAAKEDGDFFGPLTWACTVAAAKEVAAGGVPTPSAAGFVPLALLVSRMRVGRGVTAASE